MSITRILICFAVGSFFWVAMSASAHAQVMGDQNADGQVTQVDVDRVQDIADGDSPFSALADLDATGDVTARDVAIVTRIKDGIPMLAARDTIVAAAGATITLSGVNFGTSISGIEVRVNGTLATVTSVNNSQLQFTVPASPSNGPIRVKLVGGSDQSNVIFFKVAP